MTTDPNAYIEVLARLLCAADVHVHDGDHPTWQQLRVAEHGRGQDDYRKAASWLQPKLTIAAETRLSRAERRCDELRAESKRRGKTVLEQSEKIRALEREIDGLQAQLGAEILQADQPAVPGAVPPADRAGLRELIAEALLDHLSRTADIRPGKTGQLAFMPEITDPERLRIADAVLTALPAGPSEAHRLALSTALGLGTSAPWDAIRERAAELAGQPVAVDRGADADRRLYAWAHDIDTDDGDIRIPGVRSSGTGPEAIAIVVHREDMPVLAGMLAEAGGGPVDRGVVLAEAGRQFLTFALDLAADQMASRGDEFGDEDTAALDTLRRLAAETPTAPPGCWYNAEAAEQAMRTESMAAETPRRSRTARLLDAVTHSGPGYDLNPDAPAVVAEPGKENDRG